MKRDLALYQLSDLYLQQADRLADLDAPADQVEAILTEIGGEIAEKATNVAMVIKNMEATAKEIKAAEDAMYQRRKAIEARAEQVREYLLKEMQRTGFTKVECPYFKISLRDNPPAVVVDESAVIPDEYWRYPPPPDKEIDKTKLKEDLKLGVVIPGVRLESKQRVEIK